MSSRDRSVDSSGSNKPHTRAPYKEIGGRKSASKARAEPRHLREARKRKAAGGANEQNEQSELAGTSSVDAQEQDTDSGNDDHDSDMPQMTASSSLDSLAGHVDGMDVAQGQDVIPPDAPSEMTMPPMGDDEHALSALPAADETVNPLMPTSAVPNNRWEWPCIRCHQSAFHRLTCNHALCNKCELKVHWMANKQKCNDCETGDKEKERLKSENDMLKRKLQKGITVSDGKIRTSVAHSETVRRRCEELHSAVVRLSGAQSVGELTAECAYLLREYLKRRMELTLALRKSDLPGFVQKLTAEQDLALCCGAHLTGKQRRFISSELNKLGLNVFAPRAAYEDARRSAEIKTDLIFTSVNLTEGTQRSLMRVASVRDMLIQKLRELKERNELMDLPQFRGKLMLIIGGDKGGSSTKLVAAFANVQKPNSVHNQILLAMYDGTDNADNLRTALSELAAQLNDIETLPVPDGSGKLKVMPVERYLVGDTMFLSHILGHMGTSALFPCPFCAVPKAHLKTAADWNVEAMYTSRTIEQIAQAAHSTKLQKARAQSVQSLSVSREPLFTVPIENVCPPLLHIMLGVVGGLFKALEQCCWNRDKAAVGLAPNANTRKELATLIKSATECDTKVESIRVMVKQNEQLIQALKIAISSPQTPAEQCDGIVCLNDAYRSVSDRSNTFIQCTKCRRYLHYACEGIATSREIAVTAASRYTCLQCQGISTVADLVKISENKAQVTKEKLTELVAEQQTTAEKQAALTDIIERNSGPCTKRLAAALKDLGVDIQSYQSCTFVGNHVRKMVAGQGPMKLASVLGTDAHSSADRVRFEKMFTCLGQIQDYFVARFLSDEEIAQVEQRCLQFAFLLKKDFPLESVTPKMHFLTAHLPAFAKRHGTLGLFSEQSLESLHAKVNGIERQYCTIRDDPRRLKLVMQHLYVTSSVLQ